MSDQRISRRPSTLHHPLQDSITACRPQAAIEAAQRSAPAMPLTDENLTWEIATAVLSRVTGTPHVLVPDAEHAPILDQLLSADADARAEAHRAYPGYVIALDLAAGRDGLTALYGLVYGWHIIVLDYETEQEVADIRVGDGTWADAERIAAELLQEHDILDGAANILTCRGHASTVYS